MKQIRKKHLSTTKRKTSSKKGLGDLYRPSSKAKSLGVDTPDSMSYEIHQSLERLKKAVVNVDDFVQNRQQNEHKRPKSPFLLKIYQQYPEIYSMVA